MIDYHTNLVAALETILPTHYELFLHSGLDTPCISYMEIANNAEEEGDTIGYSTIAYQVKVWGSDLQQLQHYAKAIDALLRPLGWKRISSHEMADNNSPMIQKIMTYQALGLEDF